MILQGLRVIHGIVHGDIKPDNILVFSSEHGFQLKITDFGMAKEPGEEASESNEYECRGTPAYMSPESVARREIETAMDVWSLGCVVLTMVTGKHPWRDAKGKVLEPRRIVDLLALTEMMPGRYRKTCRKPERIS